MNEGWHRLHPLSPLIGAGRGLTALVVVLLPAIAARRTDNVLVDGGIFVVLVGVGAVHWLVTRWCVEQDDLRIETGLLRRSSQRYPLQQIQAIDLVKPGFARFFGLAELRLRMAGSTGGHGRLAYLPEAEAERLRVRLLELARGAAPDAAAERPPSPERVLLVVPTPRLVGSLLLSRTGIVTELVVVAVIVLALVDPGVAAGVVGSGFFAVIAVGVTFWRRFNDEYRLTVSETEDGLRLHAGLVAVTNETIPRGRVQAVRMLEPLFWRPFGWCRVEVDVAGRHRAEGEGAAERRPLRAVLPVGSKALAAGLLERILPEAPIDRLPPPRRARWKSPLRWHYLAWGRTDRCVVATTGRVARTTDWVPLEKVQSLRLVQGPVQRRLGLKTVHLDTAGRNVHAALRDRDAAEADDALAALVALARAARRTD